MESVYQDIEGCGPFQIGHTIRVQATRFAVSWVVYLMVFGNYVPPWKCIPQQEEQQLPQMRDFINRSNHSDLFYGECYKGQQNVNRSDILLNESQQQLIDVSYSNETTEMFECNHTCGCLDAGFVIEFDSDCRTIVSEFGLVCNKAYIPSVIVCIQMIGMMIGSYISGQVGERFGRRVGLYSSLALCSVSSLLAICSQSWQVYSVFIFFNGIGSGGVMVTHSIYTMEFLEGKWRGILSGLPIWNVAACVFAVVIFILRDWVYIHIAAGSISALACLGVFGSHESLRWLIIHGKDKKVELTLKKMLSANNSKKDVTEIIDRIATAKENEHSDRKYSYLDLFRNSNSRVITIMISVMSFSIYMTYYAFSFSIKSLAGDFFINVLIAGISEVPVVLLVAPMSNKIGRRMSLVVYLVFISLACFIVVIFKYVDVNQEDKEFGITLLALFAKGASAACVNLINLMSVELFPTAVRNLGLAFTGVVGRIGSILAPYLIPNGETSVVIFYIVIGLASFVSVTLTMCMPETKNSQLKDFLVEGKKEEEEVVESPLIETKTFLQV